MQMRRTFTKKEMGSGQRFYHHDIQSWRQLLTAK
jgi:hypothetical protein